MFGRSLRDTMRAFGRQSLRVLAIQGLLLAGFLIVSVVVALLARQAVRGLLDFLAPDGMPDPARILGVGALVGLVGLIALLPVVLAAMAAAVGVADDALARRRASLRRWAVRGLRRWVPLTGAVLVALVVPVVLLLASPLLVVVGLSGLAVLGVLGLVRRRRARAWAWWPPARRWAVLATPFLLFAHSVAASMLAIPAAVLEPAGPIEALRIGWRQAAGRRWPVVGVVAIVLLGYAVLFALLGWAAPALLATDDLGSFVVVLLALLTAPVSLFAMVAAYRSAAGDRGRALGPEERAARRDRLARGRSAAPGFAARVAMLVIASLVLGTIVLAPGAATAADPGPSITPTIHTTAPVSVRVGDPYVFDVAVDHVTEMAGAANASIELFIYPAGSTPAGLVSSSVNPGELNDPRLINHAYLALAGGRRDAIRLGTGTSAGYPVGDYEISLFFTPTGIDAASYLPSSARLGFTVARGTSLAMPDVSGAPGAPVTVFAVLNSSDDLGHFSAAGGTVEFRTQPYAGGDWSGWSAPVAVGTAGCPDGAWSCAPFLLTAPTADLRRVQARYLPAAGYAPADQGDVTALAWLGAEHPTFRETIGYVVPEAGRPAAFTDLISADDPSNPFARVAPIGGRDLYLYSSGAIGQGPNGAATKVCTLGSYTETAPGIWRASCTVTLPTAGQVWLLSGGMQSGDGFWERSASVVYDDGDAGTTSDQWFVVAALVQDAPTLSLSTSATDWVGGTTIRLSWSVTGPTGSTPITIAEDGTTVFTATSATGSADIALPMRAGIGANVANTTFTLHYAGSALWAAGSTTLTGALTACIPLGALTATPSGAGGLAAATPTSCGSGATAGWPAGTAVHFTASPTNITSLREASLGDPGGPIAVTGNDIVTTADVSRSPISVIATFEPTCATVTLPTTVTVAETPNCGSGRWTLVTDGATIQQRASYLAGTIVHLTAAAPVASQVWAGWTGPIASGTATDRTVGVQVTNAGITTLPGYTAACFAVTGIAGPTGMPGINGANCRLTTASSANDGFRPGSTVQVVVGWPAGTDGYLDTITATDPDGGRQTTRTSHVTTSNTVRTSFTVTAPLTISYATGRCVLIQTSVRDVNHDASVPALGTDLFTHVTTPGCGTHPAGSGAGAGGRDNAAYAAVGDTVTITSSLPTTGYWQQFASKLFFQSWAVDTAAVTPPAQPSFAWTVSGPIAFTATWGQQVDCQPITVVSVPENAFNVTLTGLQSNGCPAGTFDLGDLLAASQADGAQQGENTIRIDIAPRTGITQGAAYGIAYTSNRYDPQTKTTSARTEGATGGLSRAIPAFGATTVTLYACQSLSVVAKVQSPADGRYLVAPDPNAFFATSLGSDCTIDGKQYWAVGDAFDVAALPDLDGYAFQSWEQPGWPVNGTIASVTMNGQGAGPSLTASFGTVCHTFTSNYDEPIVVTPAPNCPGVDPAAHRYVAGTVVSLSPQTVSWLQAHDYLLRFGGFTGGPDAVTGTTASIVMNADRAVYVQYDSNGLSASLARASSSLAQTFVGSVASALGAFLMNYTPVGKALSLVTTVLSVTSKLLDAVGADGSVVDAMQSAADATAWFSNLVQAPLHCIADWSGGGDGGTGAGDATLQQAAGTSIGRSIAKQWTRMDKGEVQSGGSEALQVAGTGLATFQMLNGWIKNANNDPSATWGSFTSSMGSCLAKSIYPPGT